MHYLFSEHVKKKKQCNMNRILYFILFVSFIKVQCKNNSTKEELRFIEHNKKFPKHNSNQLTTEGKRKKSQEIINLIKKNHKKIDDESATFHPDTKLVDIEKINQENIAISRFFSNNQNESTQNLISFDEAMNLTKNKLKPVKSMNYTIDIPNPVDYSYMKNPPHGPGVKNVINLESRKLLVRPRSFDHSLLDMLTFGSNPCEKNKSIKKDLSKINYSDNTS